MQHLPNLGRLDLRLHAKTGTNPSDGDGDADFDNGDDGYDGYDGYDGDDGDDDDTRRVRPRLTLLNPEQQDRIQLFLDQTVRRYMGLDETDPPPSETAKGQLIAEVRSEVARMYEDLSEDWPNKLGTVDGLSMFPAGRRLTGTALVKRLIDLWLTGFAALDEKRKRSSQVVYDYEQIKQSMRETERKEADAVNDNGYFEERTPDSGDVPSIDPELRAELKKKVARGDEKRWAQEGHRDRCCTGAWGRL